MTDEKYFKGKIEDLIEIRKEVQLPILRKDFIVDDYQIYESKLIGADCILIILSMLSQDDADRFDERAGGRWQLHRWNVCSRLSEEDRVAGHTLLLHVWGTPA